MILLKRTDFFNTKVVLYQLIFFYNILHELMQYV